MTTHHQRPTITVNVDKHREPREPATVYVTTADGARIEYAHIPNGDPRRIEHFLAEARSCPTFSNVSTAQ